jgi:hypothetical protein
MGLLRRVSRYKLRDHIGSETIGEQRIEVPENCSAQWMAQVERMAWLREICNAEFEGEALEGQWKRQ